MQSVSESLGISEVTLAGGVTLLASYPFALLFGLFNRYTIPSNENAILFKHLYSIVASATLFCLVFPLRDFIQLFACATICYFIIYFGNKSKTSALLVFAFSMLHLSVNHLLAQYFAESDDRFDATAPMMILVIKLSSFAWSLYDSIVVQGQSTKLNTHQTHNVITTFPTLVEFYGFIFFFGGFLVGPAISFCDYRDFIQQTGDFIDIPSMRYRILPTLKCIMWAVSSFIVMHYFSDTYDYNVMISREFLASTTFLDRLQFLMCAGFVARQKYYVGWKLSEGACNLCGIGFSKRTPSGRPIFKRVRNIDILRIEFPVNSKELIESWNKATASWLKNDVYLRLTTPGVPPSFSTLVVTFATSAFWHGFWPGYYLFFLVSSLMNVSARFMRRNIRPIFIEYEALQRFKPFYDLAGTFSTLVMINYIAGSFQLLSIEKSFKFFSSLDYFIHIILIAVTILDFIVPKIIGNSKNVKRKKSNGETTLDGLQGGKVSTTSTTLLATKAKEE